MGSAPADPKGGDDLQRRRRRGARVFWAVIVLSLVVGIYEGIVQHGETLFLRNQAELIVASAGPTTRRRVEALRDYVRKHVDWHGIPQEERGGIFRASAVEILRTGRGWCGESTRAFICLAGALGIEARRINLYGERPAGTAFVHVVAEMTLDGEDVVVDCQEPPQFPELVRFDDALASLVHAEYSTINLRRLHLSWLASRLQLNLGAGVYWTENPHAMQSLLWFAFSGLLVTVFILRLLLRWVLRKRGWVHSTDATAIREAARDLPNER